ncbi:MAG: ChbG/HpnK family deacetylase [Geobacter sp.]|nr:ChbG/HpnK family deacetylase [Geobacter sp.]
MNERRVIINADDFGVSSAVNRAVIKGWREGVLTSASLMVTGAACDEAVDLARQNPGLQIGLRLTLVQGKSALHHGGFPALTDREGNFPNDPVLAGMRMFFIKPLHRQLASEIEAQIEKFIATDLPLSHIDGHLNIHMHPTVFDILCPLLAKYDISSFRLSSERLGNELQIARNRLMGKAIDAFIFGRLADRCRSELKIRRVAFATEVKGLLNSGRITEEYLLKALDSLQAGLTEVYLHPAEADNPQLPGYLQTEELAALLSGRVKEKLRKLGIKLCNYRGEVKDV